MKKRIALGVAALSIALVSTASAALVSGGVPIYIHGAAFHAYNAAEAISIDYVTSGVRTIATSPRYVIASVDHSLSTGGISYYVSGTHSGVQSTSCTSYTYDQNGNLLSSQSGAASGVSGAWSIFLMLQGTGNAANVYNSVLCVIPANSAGTITSIRENVN